MTRKNVRFASILLLAVSGLLLMGAGQAEDFKVKAGDSPPDEIGRDVNGKRLHLSDYRGKVIIVSFFASWCGPCRKELPILSSLQHVAGKEQLQVFSVNYGESREQFMAVRRWLKNSEIDLVGDEHKTIGRKFGVGGIPHMVIIGRDGKVAAVHIGYGEGMVEGLVAEINELLTSEPSTIKRHEPPRT